MFENKYSEALRFLMALRPKELVVECLEGWEATGSSQAEVKGLKKLFGAKGEVSFNTGSKSKILCQTKFHKPSIFESIRKPSLPKDLIWFPYEEHWKTIAKGRIKGKLKEIDLEILYKDHFGINAEVAASLAKIPKIKIEGEFEKHSMKKWRIRGEFW